MKKESLEKVYYVAPLCVAVVFDANSSILQTSPTNSNASNEDFDVDDEYQF